MIAEIFEKITKRQELTDEERVWIVEWFRRVERTPEQMETIFRGVSQVSRVSQIAEHLGLVLAGEFRVGNGVTPGDGFTGGRFGYPGFSYNSQTYFLAGVLNDVLQVGLRLDNGTIIGGAGDVTIDADGIWITNQQAAFGFEDTNGDRFNLFIYSDGDDAIGIINELPGKAIRLSVTLTDASTPYVKLYEMPTEANTTQLEINAGSTATRVLIGNDIILRANKDGTETVFNERSNDIDFRVESAANANAVKLDAGAEIFSLFDVAAFDDVNELITFFGGLAAFDNGTDKRLEIGADHYFPTRSSSNPNGFWNEANQDMDFTFEGDNADVVFKSDAGLDAAQFGSRIDITSDITPTALSGNQNDYNPTGLSTATVLRLEASGATRLITGLQGGADGRIIIIHNIGATNHILLVSESASSSADNRFALVKNKTIPPKEAVILQYDSTSSRWRLLGSSASALQGVPIDEDLITSITNGDVLRYNSSTTEFERHPQFDDTEGDPANLGTAADGTSTFAARRDHVHLGGAGTYTPTLTNTTNIAASAVTGAFQYMRVGNIVTVAGNVTIDPTLAAPTLTELSISLPIASNFSAATDASGNGTAQAPNTAGSITADSTNDRVVLSFQATSAANTSWRVIFMYQVN